MRLRSRKSERIKKGKTDESRWPTPAVWWFRNDRLVDNSSTVISPAPLYPTDPGASGSSLGTPGVAHVTNELVIPSLGRSDLHSQLTCQAANNNRSLPLAATVHVDMNCESFFITSSVRLAELNRITVPPVVYKFRTIFRLKYSTTSSSRFV
ncbi:hypothetical protein J437_LFUL010381 [Ladona fulva]|uniref:Uncharacterized protein n=1 Tax=Ladona fulva TaxID=123851 RepID=A0A8K0KHC5_LADFU|nr:hypothetical protein J437_LFUL010381 [Ladona fulva]